ncbi:hypothetical protein I79_000608 [Cricetulus griseus]|uniref:Uncharacterized protein n=1 Tax=Cricetulus griseus TaxID=10029 RepID=G3GSJ3_CRIGR|nr:hypothetical protein I79_000608 [Cricetulus griseus]
MEPVVTQLCVLDHSHSCFYSRIGSLIPFELRNVVLAGQFKQVLTVLGFLTLTC